MKQAVLTREEKEIERDFEKYRPVPAKTKIRLEKLIERSRQTRPVSLRINERDLERLKEKAGKNGLPYQTMINVVIHKYVTDAFLDKEEISKFLQLKKAG